MTRAVTIDFHNTIASCDHWFELEVFSLVPTFLDWYRGENGTTDDGRHHELGRERYREIRRQVMDSGVERDAASCIVDVLEYLEIDASPEDVERGLDAIFRPKVVPAKPMPGVVESVRELHRSGVPLMVVSSAAYHPFLEWTLERFDILECFKGVLTSAACGHYKSSAKIYELAAERLGREPGDCIHIGDSEQFDVLSARCAGMKTVLVDWDGRHNGTSQADLWLNTLEDLPSRLEERFGSLAHAI